MAAEAFEPDVARWAAWRPEEIARRLVGVRAPWYVAAGWAIDLSLGGEWREHEDLEIAVPGERFGEVAAALRGMEFFVVGDGMAWSLAGAGAEFENHHQTWVREPETGLWRVDVFREPSVDGEWVCRRDPSIRLPYERVMTWTESGIPYARPEIALLFKAKATRPKDEADFARVLSHLGPEAREWLAWALGVVAPRHRWLGAVG